MCAAWERKTRVGTFYEFEVHWFRELEAGFWGYPRVHNPTCLYDVTITLWFIHLLRSRYKMPETYSEDLLGESFDFDIIFGCSSVKEISHVPLRSQFSCFAEPDNDFAIECINMDEDFSILNYCALSSMLLSINLMKMPGHFQLGVVRFINIWSFFSIQQFKLILNESLTLRFRWCGRLAWKTYFEHSPSY